MFKYQPLVVETTRTGKTTIVSCQGEIDIATLDRFAAPVSVALKDRPETLVLDLSAVEFLALVGARFISSALQQAAATNVRLVVISKDAVQRTLDLLEIDYRTAPKRRTSLEAVMGSYIATERNARRSELRRGPRHQKAA